jgi:hypothetical protein
MCHWSPMVTHSCLEYMDIPFLPTLLEDNWTCPERPGILQESNQQNAQSVIRGT